jgi:hypothetical protein
MIVKAGSFELAFLSLGQAGDEGRGGNSVFSIVRFGFYAGAGMALLR